MYLVALNLSKQPTQLIVELNSSLWHIIVTELLHKKSGKGNKKEEERRKKGNAQCIFYGFSTTLKLACLAGPTAILFSFEHFSAFTAWLRVITLVSRLCVCLHLGNWKPFSFLIPFLGGTTQDWRSSAPLGFTFELSWVIKGWCHRNQSRDRLLCKSGKWTYKTLSALQSCPRQKR